MIPILFYEILGYISWWFAGEEISKRTPWYINEATLIAGGVLLTRPIPGWGSRSAAIWTGRALTKSVVAPVSRVLTTRAALAVRAGTWAGVINVAKYSGAIGAGYVIGAVGGTAISGAIWGEEGKQHALDFYTGKGKYGEYFDIVGNVDTIWNAYFSGNP